ncbi:MAG: hypothetical protein ACJ8FP_08780 [Xanthobacteraceae bacterium]
MRVFEIRGIDPDASAIASQAFARSWHFIERDPVLAGHDRETLQAQLVLQIQRLIAADVSERDPLRIANRAIGRVREEMCEPERRYAEVMHAK